MYALIGYRTFISGSSIRDGDYKLHYSTEEEIVALFTTEEKAIKYAEDSKLKQPSSGKKFRNKSLLLGFDYYHIELYSPEHHQIDPTI